MGVTRAGAAEIAGLGIDVGSPTAFSHIAYGTDNTAFAATQTALYAESQRIAASVSRVTTTFANDTMRFTGTFTATAGETVKEVAILNAASGGDMLARNVLTVPKTLTTGDQYVLTYDIPVTI